MDQWLCFWFDRTKQASEVGDSSDRVRGEAGVVVAAACLADILDEFVVVRGLECTNIDLVASPGVTGPADHGELDCSACAHQFPVRREPAVTKAG